MNDWASEQAYQKKQRQGENNELRSIKLTIPFKIVNVSCGYDFAVFQDAFNGFYSSGNNKYGQLGRKGDSDWSIGKIQVNIDTKTSWRIRCGWTHTVIFNSNICLGWGQHQFGALGYNSQHIINAWIPRKVPILIEKQEQLVDVSCGNNITIFKISNSFYCVGDNSEGQLGLLIKKPIFQPHSIQIENSHHPRNQKLLQLKGGNNFTIGLSQNGILYGAGNVQKLGFRTRQKGLIPIGLVELDFEQLKNQTIKQIYCDEGLIIKYQSGIFTYKTDKQNKSLNHTQMLMYNGSTKMHVLFKKDNSQTFVWKVDKNNLQSLKNQPYINRTQLTKSGNLICIEITNQIKPGQGQTKYPQIELEHLTKLYQNDKRNQNQIQVDRISRNSFQDIQITKLTNEIKQQKQIIRLYENYVKKVQKQNRELRKIAIIESNQNIHKSNYWNESQEQDQMGEGLSTLRTMIADIIKQCKSK